MWTPIGALPFDIPYDRDGVVFEQLLIAHFPFLSSKTWPALLVLKFLEFLLASLLSRQVLLEGLALVLETCNESEHR